MKRVRSQSKDLKYKDNTLDLSCPTSANNTREILHHKEIIETLELGNKNLNIEVHKLRKELEFYKNLCHQYEKKLNINNHH